MFLGPPIKTVCLLRISCNHSVGFVLLTALCFAGAVRAAPAGVAAQPRSPDELARSEAEQFITKLEASDVPGMVATCQTPWLDRNHELITDPKALERKVPESVGLGLKNPLAIGFRKITTCVPYPIFRAKLAGKAGTAAPGWLARLDSMQLGEQDRVVFATWMYVDGLLVRVRDGKARIVGMEQDLPAQTFADLTSAQQPYQWIRDVVYGRKFGTALTMDVAIPKAGPNGAAVVLVASGDFVSEPLTPDSDALFLEYVSRGYTVFIAGHGGVPQYTIPDMVGDLHRAVRYVRFNAGKYGIDPDRIGITGTSSGGYLSLMVGAADGKGPSFVSPADPTAVADPVEAVSSRVRAVACFFPPTDWLNYGGPGKSVLDVPLFKEYPLMFAFREFDPSTHGFRAVTDAKKRREILAAMSPANLVTSRSAPTLILHGERDPSVPVQQSQEMMEKLKAAGVPAELVVKPGAGHGWAWPEERKDIHRLADWFDRHLQNPSPAR